MSRVAPPPGRREPSLDDDVDDADEDDAYHDDDNDEEGGAGGASTGARRAGGHLVYQSQVAAATQGSVAGNELYVASTPRRRRKLLHSLPLCRLASADTAPSSRPPAISQSQLQQMLVEVENFAFTVPTHPDEDPSGRLAFKAMCDRIDQEKSFYRFPILSVMEKLRVTGKWELDRCGLGDKGAIALAEALRVNETVTTLSVVDNGLSLVGGEALFGALSKSKSMKRVDVSDNNLGDATLEEHGMGAVIKALLAKNAVMQELILKNNRLSDRDAESIAEGCIENSSLLILDLEQNRIGPRGGEALGRMLGANAELREINLSFNQLRYFGSMALLQGLQRNNTVRRVFLAWNGVDEDGGVLLGHIIGDNGALEEIDVSNNRIGRKGAESIAQGLKSNEALKRLALNDNPLGDAGCAAIVSSMETSNETLIKLDIRNTDAGKLATDALRKTMAARELADSRRQKGDVRPATEVLVPRNLFMPAAW